MGIRDFVNKVFRADVYTTEYGWDKKKGRRSRDPFERQKVQAPKEMEPGTLYQIYRGSELGGKVVDDLSEDMVREWFTIKTESDRLGKDIQAALTRLDAKSKIQDMIKWSMIFGDGYCSIGITGDAEPTEPIEKVDEVSYLHSFSRLKMKDQITNGDLMSEEYGDFEQYKIKVPIENGGTSEQDVHPDRILHLQMNPRLDSKWGESIFTRLQNILVVLDNTVWSVGQIIFQLWFKTLKTNLRDKTKDDIADIASEMENELNALSLWLLHKDKDAEEELDFPSSTMNISGFGDIVEFLKQMAAMAVRRPQAVLFGAQAGTLSASDVDALNDYKRTSSLQEAYLRPLVERLVHYIAMSLNAEDVDYSLEFNELYTYDDETKANIRETKTKAYEKEILNGILTAQEIREEEYNRERIDISPPE